MAIHTFQIKRAEWPSIRDGTPTDRGWQHVILLRSVPFSIAIGDDVRVRFQVPGRENWMVQYIAWAWASSPGWASAKIIRELGQRQLVVVELGVPPLWGSEGGELDRRMYTVPAGDKDGGNVARIDMKTDVGGVPGGDRLGMDWLGAVAAQTPTLIMHLQLIRIPMARERRWTQPDLETALTGIDALARRVN